MTPAELSSADDTVTYPEGKETYARGEGVSDTHSGVIHVTVLTRWRQTLAGSS
jgi:hypothetical protein